MALLHLQNKTSFRECVRWLCHLGISLTNAVVPCSESQSNGECNICPTRRKAIIGWVFTPATLEPFWAVLLGASSALVFTLGIALPPLMAGPERVARLTGVTLSLNYCVALVGPLLGGIASS